MEKKKIHYAHCIVHRQVNIKNKRILLWNRNKLKIIRSIHLFLKWNEMELNVTWPRKFTLSSRPIILLSNRPLRPSLKKKKDLHCINTLLTRIYLYIYLFSGNKSILNIYFKHRFDSCNLILRCENNNKTYSN